MTSTTTLDASVTEASIRDYWTLLKPGVMSLVVFTGAVGMWMAPGHLPPLFIGLTILAIALGSGAGAAINMWYDRDIDARMRRTAKRPIPAGRIAADDALALGIGLAVLSVTLLFLVAGAAPAGLLAFAIWYYACFYTMGLKRRTAQNIVIGGAAGAFPPVIGWLAMTPYLSVEPLLYFLIVFLWTPPHFWALALYRSEDYRAVNVPMLPVIAGEASTLRHIMCYSLLLFVVSVLPSTLGHSGAIYLLGSVLLSGRFAWLALKLWQHPCDVKAIGLFKFSILYLFALFSLLIIDKYFHIPISRLLNF
ncbi:MAG: heme o synthase [Rickettsiales bacterium]|nr:heme o synthase [Rickettsiales bacterium]